MSFSSPSALAGCDAPSGAAGLRTIPLRRLRLACDPRVRFSQACVALAVLRLADAMRWGSTADLSGRFWHSKDALRKRSR